MKYRLGKANTFPSLNGFRRKYDTDPRPLKFYGLYRLKVFSDCFYFSRFTEHQLPISAAYNNYNIRGKITELIGQDRGHFFLIFVIAPGKITWKWLAENRLATAAKVKKFLFVL